MRRIAALISLIACCASAHADLMARGKITMLDATTSSSGTFAIKVDGPGGYVCNGNPQALSASNFPDADSFKRTYAAALMALSMGYTVELYSSPVSASCPYMVGIRVIPD